MNTRRKSSWRASADFRACSRSSVARCSSVTAFGLPLFALNLLAQMLGAEHVLAVGQRFLREPERVPEPAEYPQAFGEGHRILDDFRGIGAPGSCELAAKMLIVADLSPESLWVVSVDCI